MSKISKILDNIQLHDHRSCQQNVQHHDVKNISKNKLDILQKNPLFAAYPEIKVDILRKLSSANRNENNSSHEIKIDRGQNADMKDASREDTAVNMVDHPPQYQFDNPMYEPIKVINEWKMDFNIGNAIKYLARYKKKWNPIEDLKKAIFYIQDEIDRLEMNNRQ